MCANAQKTLNKSAKQERLHDRKEWKAVGHGGGKNRPREEEEK